MAAFLLNPDVRIPLRRYGNPVPKNAGKSDEIFFDTDESAAALVKHAG